MEMTIQLAVAIESTKATLDRQQFHTTIAKHMSPTLPSAAPYASSPAACLPRLVLSIPAFCFFCRSCFSMSVALAGKIAGNADQPRENGGTAKEKSQGVFISGLPESRELDGHPHQGYFSNSSQTPDESANQSRKVAMLAGAACQRPRIMRLLQTQAYRRKAPAPAAIERVSIAAYHFPSGNTVRLSVARPTEGAAPNKSGKTLWFQHVT
jgi:hypothetical protein